MITMVNVPHFPEHHTDHVYPHKRYPKKVEECSFDASLMPCYSTGRQFVKMLNLRNVQLTQIKGFNYMGQYDLAKEGFPSDTVEEDKDVPEQKY